eukprot:s281_g14.t1
MTSWWCFVLPLGHFAKAGSSNTAKLGESDSVAQASWETVARQRKPTTRTSQKWSWSPRRHSMSNPAKCSRSSKDSGCPRLKWREPLCGLRTLAAPRLALAQIPATRCKPVESKEALQCSFQRRLCTTAAQGNFCRHHMISSFGCLSELPNQPPFDEDAMNVVRAAVSLVPADIAFAQNTRDCGKQLPCANIDFGQSVRMVGAILELGSWDPSCAPELSADVRHGGDTVLRLG